MWRAQRESSRECKGQGGLNKETVSRERVEGLEELGEG